MDAECGFFDPKLYLIQAKVKKVTKANRHS